MKDFRYYIDLLNEASYDSMIVALKRKYKDYPEFFELIDWAKTLERQDRIVWYLNDLKLRLSLNNDTQNPYYMGNDDEDPDNKKNRIISFAKEDQQELMRYLMLGIPEINNYIFKSDASYEDIIESFEKIKLEHENISSDKETGTGISVTPKKGDYKLIEFPDGSNWWYVNRAYCPDEGESGNHCGNVAGQSDTKQRILSYRDKLNRVLLTFILHADKTLGEMKARSNNKPPSSYHKVIMQLLLNPIVAGINTNVETQYAPHLNFSIFDLDDNNLKIISEKKPSLIVDQVKLIPTEIFRLPDWIKKDPKILNNISEKTPELLPILNDMNSVEAWQNGIEKNSRLILYAPKTLPNYENYLIDYFTNSNNVESQDLNKIPKEYQENSEFLKKIIPHNPNIILRLQKNIPDIRELIILGLAQLSSSAHGEDYEKVRDFYEKVIQKYSKQVQFDQDFYTQVGNLDITPDEFIKPVYIKAVGKNGLKLRDVPDTLRSYDICLAAVSNDGHALKYVMNKRNKTFSPEQFRNLFMTAVNNDPGTTMGEPTALSMVPIELRDRELSLAAVKKNRRAILDVPPKIREEIRQIIMNQNKLSESIDRMKKIINYKI
jgi:hypothetical protein